MSVTLCSADGCERPHYALGFCRGHWERVHRGAPLGGAAGATPRGPCAVDGCERLRRGHGYCQMHYARWRRHNDVTVVRSGPRPLADRFWQKVDTTGDCWEWRGTRLAGGYGMLWVRDRQSKQLAHRVAYELFVGPIPQGMEIDHLCRNRACVNPAHLEPVTHAENVRRGDAGKYQRAA